ncbi:separase [Pichia kluyveri]|uniref:separase n=1 Tax=Pichia kluyveri TaxID=36015 RepID=A0AAV5R4F2_PICKL|nr:separase [Pichia kluyveri]
MTVESTGIDIVNNINQINYQLIDNYISKIEKNLKSLDLSKIVDINISILDRLDPTNEYYNSILSCTLKLVSNSSSIEDFLLNSNIPNTEQFIHLKLFALHHISLNSPSPSQLDQIANSFNSSTDIYNQIIPLAKLNYKIISIFLQLSINLKTIHKLIFLIIAAQFAIRSDDFQISLLKKINKDGCKMFDKSSNLVHRMSNKYFYQLTKLCNNEQLSLLDELSTKFSTIKNTNDIDELINKVQKIDFNDNLQNDQIIKILNKTCKNLNKDKNTLKLIDLITYKIKDVSIDDNNLNFIYQCLSNLCDYLIIQDEDKRIGNFIKLFFHFANHSLDIDSIISMNFFQYYLKLRIFNNESLDIIVKKINYISIKEYEKLNIENSFILQLLLLNSVFNETPIFQYDSNIFKPYDMSLNILTKCIITNFDVISTLFEYIKDELLVIFILISIIDKLESLNTSHEVLISQTIMICKDMIKDTGLFFYFLSKISMNLSFGINFQNTNIGIPKNSPVIGISGLVITHLYLLQDIIPPVKDYISNWINNCDVVHTIYEDNVIDSLCEYYAYNYMDDITCEILQLYITKRRKCISSIRLHQIFKKYIDSCLKTEQYSKIMNLIQKEKLKLNYETYDGIELSLNIALIQKDMQTVDKINKTLHNDEKYKLSKISRQSSIRVLFILSKLCQICGYLSNDNINQVVNLRRSMSILQSIFKNFILDKWKCNWEFLKQLKMKFSYEMLNCYSNLIETYSKLGMQKEFNYYLKEMTVFLQIQTSESLKHVYSLKLVDYYMYIDDIEKAKEIMDSMSDIEINKFLNIYKLTVFENYYRKTKDSKLGNTMRQLDDSVNGLLVSSELDYSWIKSMHEYAKNRRIETVSRKTTCYPIFNETVPRNSSINLQNYDNISTEMFQLGYEKSINELLTNIDSGTDCNEDIWNIIKSNEFFKMKGFQYEKQFATYDNTMNLFPEMDIKTIKPDIDLSLHIPSDWIIVNIEYIESSKSLVIWRYENKYKTPFFINLPIEGYDEIIKEFDNIIEQSDLTTSIEITSKIHTIEEKRQWWDKRNKLDNRMKVLVDKIDDEWFGGFNSIFGINNSEVDWLIKDIKKMIPEFNKFHKRIFEMFLHVRDVSERKILQILNFLTGFIDVKYTNEYLIDVSKVIFGKVANIVNENGHIILIPGNGCLKIPWESIPTLRMRSVSRMPSISQICQYLNKFGNIELNDNKGYYVINPGGDLQRTEYNLGKRLKDMNGWEGVIGKPPNESDILKAFNNVNMYLYAGHGGGEQYLQSRKVKSRESIPVTMLAGCSSGRMKQLGFSYAYGTAFNYINGKCPMLIANMWDVTDRDIDKLTVAVLDKPNNLCQGVGISRNVCKLTYLNGASAVVYGIPV